MAVTWTWSKVTIEGSNLEGALASYTERIQVPVGSSVQRVICTGQIQNAVADTVPAGVTFGQMPVLLTWQLRVSPDSSEGEYIWSVQTRADQAQYFNGTSANGGGVIFDWSVPGDWGEVDIRARKRITGAGGGVDVILKLAPAVSPNPSFNTPNGLWTGGFFTQVLYSTPASI